MTMEAPQDILLEKGHAVTFHELAGKILEFRDIIEIQRKALGLTQEAAAILVPVSVRTWKRWASGDVVPSVAMQNAVVARLGKAIEPPSRRHREALAKSHHLHWERHKGWVLRLTVDIGKKVVGKRVKIYLRTYDETESKMRRMVVMAAYRALGIRFSTKVQRAPRRAGTGG